MIIIIIIVRIIIIIIMDMIYIYIYILNGDVACDHVINLHNLYCYYVITKGIYFSIIIINMI